MSDYISIVRDALAEFYQNDARYLFDVARNVDERAMVGCIYRYVWSRLKAQGGGCDVDIEYDRMSGRNGGLARKSIDLALECGDEHCRKSCLRIIATKIGRKIRNQDKVYSIRPDLIIHKRNSPPGKNNFLVAEFKKANARKSEIEFDRAKIRWTTCKYSLLKYKIGLFVTLHGNYATLEQYDENGCFPLIEHVNGHGLYEP